MTHSSHEIPKQSCPWCDYVMDTASSLDHQHKPKPGDVTVCMSCAQILMLTDKMELRKTTSEEERDILQQAPQVKLLIKAIKSIPRDKLTRSGT